MKIASQIEALEKLAELDKELSGVEGELSREREALGQRQARLRDLDARLEAARTSIADMERTRNELHQDARQMANQMERSREKLNRCRNEREANAAQREVEEFRKLYRDREIEIEKLTTLCEQARGEHDVTAADRDRLAAELGAGEGELATRLAALEASAGARRGERTALAAAVPPAQLRRYETLRKRLGSAVAHTVDGTCSACHIRLPPMQFQKMTRGEAFDQCPSCLRILYYRPVAAAAADAAAGAP